VKEKILAVRLKSNTPRDKKEKNNGLSTGFILYSLKTMRAEII